MEREVIEVELTPEERSLILRYGYPFDRIRAALESRSKRRRIETVPLDVFELGRLIGDLSRSINDMKALTALAARPLRSSLAIAPAARHREQAFALA